MLALDRALPLRYRLVHLIASLLLLASSTPFALATGSSWVGPVGGSFGNPRLWSGGVPPDNGDVTFGLTGGARPFVVTLDVPRFLGVVSITNQAPTIDLHGLQGPNGPALVVWQLIAGAPLGPSSLTLQNGSISVTTDATVGALDGSSTLHLVEADADFAGLSVINGALTASASEVDHVPWAPPFPLRIGLDANSSASATFTNGSVVHVERLLVGGNGGTGAVTIADGALVEITSDSFFGGNHYDALLEAGVGNLTIDGGTLRKAAGANLPNLSIGSEGTGALTLRGGALLKDILLSIGETGGSATFICDGPATITESIYPRLSANVTMLVTGAATTLTAKAILAQEGNSTLDLMVTDGAHLACTTQIYSSTNDTTMHVLNGGTVTTNWLYLDNGDLLEISGPGSHCAVAGDISDSWGVTFDISHGGQLSVGTMTIAKLSTLRLGLSSGAPVPLSINGAATILGTLDIELDEDVSPRAGQSFVLAQANPLAVSWNVVNVPAIPGLLPITNKSATTLTLKFTDDVTNLEIIGPHAFKPGFVIAYHATATVDGVERDVAEFATWSSSDPSVATIERPGVVRALADGAATITVVAGPASASFELAVTDVAAPPPFALVSAGLGGPANGDSSPALIGLTRTGRTLSADGSIIALDSNASNLVEGDANESWDVFVRTLDDASMEFVSIGLDGSAAGDSALVCISGDGRFVEFGSFANLVGVPGPPDSLNVYVRDRFTGATDLVSVTMSGSTPFGTSQPIGISDDGRFAAFTGSAGSFVPNDTNGADDVFVRDRWMGTTTRVSTNSSGEQINDDCLGLDMTPDGMSVVIKTIPLEIDDAVHFSPRIRVKRLDAGALIDVTQALGCPSIPSAGISADGRFIAFTAYGLGLDGPPPPTGSIQVLVRDLETNELVAVTRLSDGAWSNGAARGVSISANGRYVSFESTATNLLPGNPLGASPQVWRFDRTTGALELVSESPAGPLEGSTGKWTSISANGRTVAFATDDPNFAAFDTNGEFDVIVRTFGPQTAGDLSGDGAVDGLDVAILLAAWGTTDASADLDGDGDVDASDLAVLLGAWTQ